MLINFFMRRWVKISVAIAAVLMFLGIVVLIVFKVVIPAGVSTLNWLASVPSNPAWIASDSVVSWFAFVIAFIMISLTIRQVIQFFLKKFVYSFAILVPAKKASLNHKERKEAEDYDYLDEIEKIDKTVNKSYVITLLIVSFITFIGGYFILEPLFNIAEQFNNYYSNVGILDKIVYLIYFLFMTFFFEKNYYKKDIDY